MIILFNLKCTPYRSGFYDRYGLIEDDRMEVFKYSIASHSVLDPIVSKYLFYITIEDEWMYRKDDLEKFMYENINNEKLQIIWKRNETVEEWQQVCNYLDTIDDNTVYMCGNDDHIFMDYDLTCMYHGMKAVEQDANPLSALIYSHWFETIRVANAVNAKLHSSGHVVSFTGHNFDGIRLVRKELWKHYWFSCDFRHYNGRLGRTDMLNGHNIFSNGDDRVARFYVPTRALCQHYDGYSHVSQPLSNYGAPLTIPPGFFDKNMKIRYGWNNEYKKDCININPMGANLTTNDPCNGFDYKYTIDRLPLFWYNRIKEINMAPSINKEEMEKAYKNWILDSLKVSMYTYGYQLSSEDTPPRNWLNKQI